MKALKPFTLVAVALTLIALPLAAQTSGDIARLGTAAFDLASGQRFSVTSTTAVTIDGVKATYTNLKVGMTAQVDYVHCKTTVGVCATLITAKTSTSTTSMSTKGTIYVVGTAAITLTSNERYSVTSNTHVTINGSKALYSNLKAGLPVSIDYVKCGTKIGVCASLIAATTK